VTTFLKDTFEPFVPALQKRAGYRSSNRTVLHAACVLHAAASSMQQQDAALEEKGNPVDDALPVIVSLHHASACQFYA
jgi:hypothetical protein